MQGFESYEIFDNGSVTENGQPIKRTAAQKTKGIVVLTASDDVDFGEAGQVKKGDKVPFEIEALLNVPDEQWTEVENVNGTDAPTEAEQTEADRIKAERKAKVKELKDRIKAKEKYLLDSENGPQTADEFTAGKAALAEARQELADFEAVAEKTGFVATPDQQILIDEYLKMLEDQEAFNQLQKDLRGALKNFELPAGYRAPKSKGGDGDVVPQRAPKLNYEKAQELRRDISEGMDPKEVCQKYDVTMYAVKCIANYTNYKLKEGDTAYTPLPESLKKVAEEVEA